MFKTISLLELYEEFPLLMPKPPNALWRQLKGYVKFREMLVPLTIEFDPKQRLEETVVESTDQNLTSILMQIHEEIEKVTEFTV